MFITNTVLGGRGFSVPSGREYLITTIDYPLILTKTLAKPPESITVYGKPDGTGDRTANLMPKLTAKKNINASTGAVVNANNAAASVDVISVDFEQNPVYTITGLVNKMKSFVAGYDENEVFVGRTVLTAVSSVSIRATSFTIAQQSENSVKYIRVTQYPTGSDTGTGEQAAAADIMMNAGSALPYEPYGYKIPLVLSDGATNKTINLYSDEPIGRDDTLVVDPKTQEATRNSTNVKRLQDWTQDFTIPKANEVTVVSSATAIPDAIEMDYWSSQKT